MSYLFNISHSGRLDVNVLFSKQLNQECMRLTFDFLTCSSNHVSWQSCIYHPIGGGSGVMNNESRLIKEIKGIKNINHSNIWNK